MQDHINAIWQIAATSGAISNLLTAMNGLPDVYQATQAQTEFTTWLRLQMGQSTSLSKIFHFQVYTDILAKIEGYNYSNARIGDAYLPPENAAVNGTTISCDAPISGTVKLYSWDFVVFTESTITGSLSDGILSFTGVPSGNYVLAFDVDTNSERFPTTFLTVA